MAELRVSSSQDQLISDNQPSDAEVSRGHSSHSSSDEGLNNNNSTTSKEIELVRKSQKTEYNSDRRGKINPEGGNNLGVCSTNPVEKPMQNDVNNSLMDLILDGRNLRKARDHVIRKKGAPGIDGMTVSDASLYLAEHGGELVKSLREGTYRPKPVKRVEIPKPDGTKRKLGIPTVVDRIVQQAVNQVLSPIMETHFSDNSYGFRPNRSAQMAIKRVTEIYDQGYHYVVDLDLKSYFDTVNHDLLMKFMEQYISDRWTLKLIRKFLTSGVMNGQLFEGTEVGTPQGGVISPLLANIYLHELDKLLTERGHQFVRYADDCNIYVRSERAGYRVLASIQKFLEKKLKLTVNPEKTKVGKPTRLNFLGFSLWCSAKGAKARPSKKSKQRLIREIRRITKRNRGVSLDQIFHELDQKLHGWIQYYSVGSMKTFLIQVDAWLRSRIRQFIWKRWKKPKTRYKALMKLGIPKEKAWTYANTRKGYWHTAHTQTLLVYLTNEKLERRGLINLSKTYQFIQARSSY